MILSVLSGVELEMAVNGLYRPSILSTFEQMALKEGRIRLLFFHLVFVLFFEEIQLSWDLTAKVKGSRKPIGEYLLHFS